MLHCDEEALALVAFGEPLDDDDRNHLKHCLRCQTELDQFQAGGILPYVLRKLLAE